MLFMKNSENMLPNTSTKVNVGFQTRSTRTSKGTTFEKSSMRNKSGAKKIVQPKSDMFMSAFKVFENALSQLRIDESVDHNKEVLEKLIKIEKIIKEKILLINENKSNNCENVEFSDERTLSVGSLYSEDFKENVKVDLSLEEFSKRVNCPFCSKLQADKIELIEHLNEGCKLKMTKTFNEKHHLPFSVFQILPNDSFKCNICPSVLLPDLKKYFEHLQKDFHIRAYDKAAKLKNYTEFLFCSCCKVQVANNYTQIHFHMNHDVHKSRRENTYNSAYFKKRKIYYVYVKSKHFKCLYCPLIIFKSPEDLITHFGGNKHVRNVTKSESDLNLLFCEVCSQEVPIMAIFKHFMSNDHRDKEKENKVEEDNYELCFFCGFVCNNLKDLKLHMESKCSIIDSLKKQNPKLKTKIDKNLRKDKVASKSNFDGGNIIVKGYKDILALFSYFEQFGQISSLEMYGEKDVLIKFKEKNTAESILFFKDNQIINGVKLEITSDDKLLNFRDKIVLSKEEKILSESENSQSSFDPNESDSDSDSDSMEDEESSDITVMQNDHLRSLFQRVTSHLVNISQKLDSTAEVKSILDCLKTLTGEECHLVGFSGCGLSFPVECISLYCLMRTNSFNVFSPGGISVNDTNLNSLTFLKIFKKQISASELWQDIITSERSFPFIKCQHKPTQKICTIICAKSAMSLTEMLRDCLKENDQIRSFCVLIRFWLTVHKLKIRQFEYVVISLIIFFLIRNNFVELSESKYFTKEDLSLKKKLQDKLNFKENSSDKKNNTVFDLQGLFFKFLEFLNTFDFDDCAICLPLAFPVPKTYVLKNFKTNTESSKYDNMSKSSMYITEFNFFHNLASYVNERHLKSLLKIVNSSVKNF